MNKFLLCFFIACFCGVTNAADFCNGPNCFYKRKNNISPNAMPMMVEVAVPKVSCNECCKKVVTKNNTLVEICVPDCSCKQEVRTSKNGLRTVYDYGKYEAVVVGRENSVEVKYRKRLLNK